MDMRGRLRARPIPCKPGRERHGPERLARPGPLVCGDEVYFFFVVSAGAGAGLGGGAGAGAGVASCSFSSRRFSTSFFNTSLFCTTNSTRRFFAMLRSFVLGAIGLLLP